MAVRFGVNRAGSLSPALASIAGVDGAGTSARTSAEPREAKPTQSVWVSGAVADGAERSVVAHVAPNEVSSLSPVTSANKATNGVEPPALAAVACVAPNGVRLPTQVIVDIVGACEAERGPRSSCLPGV